MQRYSQFHKHFSGIVYILLHIAPGVIIKDITVSWEDFTQEIAIIMKVKGLSQVFRDSIIKQHSNTQIKQIP